MSTLAAFVSGRRTKWIVVVAWILALVVIAPLGGKLQDETDDQTESFLPANAQSTEVTRTLDDQFAGGQTVSGLIVYQREGGLTESDRRKIAADARIADEVAPLVGRPTVPFAPRAPPELVSRDGSVAYTVLALPDDQEKLADWGKAIDERIGSGSGGLEVYLTGDLGFNVDAEEVFGSLDANLLIATVLLVIILLFAIYRSLLMPFIPLVVVGIAYAVAQGFVYLYAKSGATVSSNGTSILVVLMFGVGTDYCLLLVSRYREELKRFEDKHDAMRMALERTGPAILASGLTVSLAMLVLLVAETGSLKTMGPVSAIGVTCAFIAGLTLLPALLTIFGRVGFFPRRRLIAYDPNAGAERHEGIWRRIAEAVNRRPALALGATLLFFGAGALGLLAYKEDFSTTTFFKKETPSVEGFRVIESSFPAGLLSPTTVLVEREDGPVRPADVAAAVRRLRAVPDVASATPTGQVSRDRRVASIDVVTTTDPYQSQALNVVPKMRAAVADVGPGVTAIVGGGSAIQYDFDAAVSRDTKLIVPIALLVIGIILAVLLKALVAPLVLIASVVVSFFGTLGISILFIRYVVGDAGVDTSLPVFAFIFLVALGIDYTIFLMSRVREEARVHGTREGMLRAVGATGPVITSAGIILAGTFSVLMTLPVTFTFNLGFMVAVGILLDTFIVRTIMVPAAVELIGDKVWWPSSPTGGSLLREKAHEEQEAAEDEATPEPAPV